MKTLVSVVAVLLAVSGPALAGNTTAKQGPVAEQSTAKPAKCPILDEIKTFSIDPASGAGADKKQTPRRNRSGVEVNPWIVPNFL